MKISWYKNCKTSTSVDNALSHQICVVFDWVPVIKSYEYIISRQNVVEMPVLSILCLF